MPIEIVHMMLDKDQNMQYNHILWPCGHFYLVWCFYLINE